MSAASVVVVVPSGDRKRSTADGWQFERRNPQMVRSGRAECWSTRHIGDVDQRTEVAWWASMQSLVCQNSHFVQYPFWSPQPLETDKCVRKCLCWLVSVSASVNLPLHKKSRSSLLAPAHPGGPGERAVKRLWCGGQAARMSINICICICRHMRVTGRQVRYKLAAMSLFCQNQVSLSLFQR